VKRGAAQEGRSAVAGIALSADARWERDQPAPQPPQAPAWPRPARAARITMQRRSHPAARRLPAPARPRAAVSSPFRPCR